MLETRTVPKGSKHEGMVAPNMEGLRPRGLRPQDLRPQGLRPQGLRPGVYGRGSTAGGLRPGVYGRGSTAVRSVLKSTENC